MNSISWKYAGVLCFVLLAALGINYGIRTYAPAYSEAATIGNGSRSFQQLSDRFIALAEKKGAVYAFGVLKIAALPPGTDLHLMGHVVGEVLYKQEGVEGIKECTQDFRNACSHTIVIGALNEFGAGDATIEKIRTACTEAPGGVGAYTMCFHGLGHGVFAYFGYDIQKTVAFCKRLGTSTYANEEYPQCVGGMIMELIDGGGHDKDQWVAARQKYLDPADPLSPCDRALIPHEAKSFCYMYLTPRLLEVAGAELSDPDPATFPAAFRLCDAIADKTLRGMCYGSFGKEFVPLAAMRDIRTIDHMIDSEYVDAIEWCMMGGKREAKNACIEQALASVFWGGENDPQASFRFCSLVGDTAAQEACYSELSQNIGTYTNGARRTALCEQLPADIIDACKSPVRRPYDQL